MKKTLLLLASLATLLLTLTIHDTVPTAYDKPAREPTVSIVG